jgi:PDZ domain
VLLLIAACALGTPAPAVEALWSSMDYQRNGSYIVLPSTTPAIPGVFILDTGSTLMAVDGRFANVIGKGHQLSISTLGGTRSFDVHAAPALGFGPWTIPAGGQTACLQLSFLSQVTGLELAGIIGMTPLLGLVVSIDYDADTLRLSDARTAGQAEGYQALPLTIVEGSRCPRITLEIGGVSRTVDLDSGNGYAVSLLPATYDALLASGAIRAGLGSKGVTMAGTVDNASGLLSGVRCGAFAYPALSVCRLTGASPDLIDTVGLGFLARHNVIIDVPRRLLYLQQRASRLTTADVDTNIGLHLLRIDGRITAGLVDAGSPAARAGIAVGDILLTIDGRSAAGLGIFACRDLLAQCRLRQLPLTLEAHATQRTVAVTLAP